uniref:Carboxylic ester hydrolase n=1 Tax=Timema monikensis TaxID=170555 RepID=A0A7R9E7U1_9NEOP|nr:unnamed protein product [Timema monikensis]
MTDTVKVSISEGELQGKKVSSKVGGVYYSFQGIPYAKPPVGPLRFKRVCEFQEFVNSLVPPPEPPEPWTGLRDASKEEAITPQFVLSLFQPPEPPEPWTGVRDASKEEAITPQFVLSLFQPPEPPEPWNGVRDASKEEAITPQFWPVSRLKPVMVWIHGGGFEMGSGDSDFYGPDYFLAQDVVFVSINYRLGALGFLNLDGSDVSANNGLRDQVMALTWVNKNISKFGGDPDNVTIFGESAGGASVHYLLLAPSAKGLFHKAIAQSGSALLPICHLSSSVSTQRAFRLGQALGCETKDPQHLADFLRTVPAEKIVLSHGSAQSEEVLELKEAVAEKQRVLTITFTPTEDSGADAFIPGDPVKLLQEGKFHKVPFITGVASAEGKLALMGASHGEELFIIFSSSFFPSDSEPNTEDATVRTYTVKFWTNFAKTGNPNIPEEEVEWPAVTKEELFYLKISPKLDVLKDFRKERMDFLDDLFDTYPLTN